MKKRLRHFLPWRAVIAGLAITIWLLPIAWMAITSLKLPADTAAQPPRFLPGAAAPENSLWFRATDLNYKSILTDADTLLPIINSIVIALSSTLLSVVAGSFAGYALSRFDFSGKKWIEWFVLGMRLLPPMALAVPISFLYSSIGLNDTRFGLIMLYTCMNLSLCTWIMKGFFDEIPRAYEEAAFLDGYGRFESLYKVVLPQVTSGVTTCIILAGLTSWNEYAFALTLTSFDATTLPVRIHALGADASQVQWGPLSAAALLSIIPPMLFVFFSRKHLLRGMTMGAVKE